VRTSYVRKVLDAEDEPNAQEIWMLRQLKAVREATSVRCSVAARLARNK